MILTYFNEDTKLLEKIWRKPEFKEEFTINSKQYSGAPSKEEMFKVCMEIKDFF